MGCKYDYVSFVESLPTLEKNAIFQQVLTYAMKLPKTYDKTKIRSYFAKSLEDGSLSTIKDRLSVCVVSIEQQLDILENQQDVADKLLSLKNNIDEFFDIIAEVVKEKLHQDEKSANDMDTSATATSYVSFDAKTKEIQGRLDSIENKLRAHEGTLNDKLFSLIINTVAILGIFVAVAFAGFGANTLFSNIVFCTNSDIYTNTFYLLLTAFFAYNLLFLLFYCIFKIIGKLTAGSEIKLWEHCWAFIVIDIVMFIITIILFFVVS